MAGRRAGRDGGLRDIQRQRRRQVLALEQLGVRGRHQGARKPDTGQAIQHSRHDETSLVVMTACMNAVCAAQPTLFSLVLYRPQERWGSARFRFTGKMWYLPARLPCRPLTGPAIGPRRHCRDPRGHRWLQLRAGGPAAGVPHRFALRGRGARRQRRSTDRRAGAGSPGGAGRRRLGGAGGGPAVDPVAIAVPPDLQPEVAARALGLGKPVFVEKPLAANLADARMMLEAARRSRRATVIDFNFPELATWRHAKALLDGGAVGRLRHVVVTWNVENQATPAPEELEDARRCGGGLLGNFVCHCFHYLEWFCGPIAGLAGGCSVARRATRTARSRWRSPSRRAPAAACR